MAYGSQPNDINFLPDGTFVVSLGGNNALALYTFASGSWAVPPTLDGLIPTGWCPGFIVVDSVHNQILVSNARGIGPEGPNISKGPDPATNKTGPAEISTYSVVLQIDIPNTQELAAYTATEIPDQYRVDVFLLEFNQYVANNNLPSLVYLWLCDDHTSGISVGFPTPAAQVADNDLAVGRVVEAISHSPYWKDSAIFVTEDDAQDGVDHVDGHRTEGLVISPFVKRNVVDSTYYNQLSIIRTIEQILGLPLMNQRDLVTPPMRGLFTNTPNYATYTALKNNIPLNQLTTQQTASRTSKLQLAWQQESAKMFARPQKADSADPSILNHAIWYATKGFQHSIPWREDRPLPRPGETVSLPGHIRRLVEVRSIPSSRHPAAAGCPAGVAGLSGTKSFRVTRRKVPDCDRLFARYR
jgi:Phosphoesterase family